MKLTLYVPDPLFERLERFRDRINASAVLQRGLENELMALEAAKSSDGEAMERAILRLRRERDALHENLRERGQAEGMAWALSAGYADLAGIAQVVERYESKIRSNPAASYKLVRQAPRRLFAEVRHPAKADPLVEREAFWMGFLEGLMRVWRRLSEPDRSEGEERANEPDTGQIGAECL